MTESNHDAPWTTLMDEVHRLIEEAGGECSVHDGEPLCMSIASGLRLEGWKPAQQRQAASGGEGDGRACARGGLPRVWGDDPRPDGGRPAHPLRPRRGRAAGGMP